MTLDDAEVRAAMVPLVRLMHKRGLVGVRLDKEGTVCHIFGWSKDDRKNLIEFGDKLDVRTTEEPPGSKSANVR